MSTHEHEPHTNAQVAIGDFAPELADLTDKVLFDRVWARSGLARRDRSLLTVAALITGGNAEQLEFHLGLAKQNGLSNDELIEAITHLAFYSGWPKAFSAIGVARRVLEADE